MAALAEIAMLVVEWLLNAIAWAGMRHGWQAMIVATMGGVFALSPLFFTKEIDIWLWLLGCATISCSVIVFFLLSDQKFKIGIALLLLAFFPLLMIFLSKSEIFEQSDHFLEKYFWLELVGVLSAPALVSVAAALIYTRLVRRKTAEVH